MSYTVTNVCRPAQMPPTAKNVLMAIADRADDRGIAWPSIPGLCEATCFGRTAVIDAVKWLEDAGFVVVEKSAGCNNRFTIDLDRVAAAPRASRRAPPAMGQPVRLADPSATRTGSGGEPVRQADPTGPSGVLPPVRLPDRPVRQPDPNHQEPPTNHQEPPVAAARATTVALGLAAVSDNRIRTAQPKPVGKGAAVWESYSVAYTRKYGVPPVRNSKVNSILTRLVDRLGAADAPAVAAYYLTHKSQFYVNAGHAVDLLLRDAEKLCTEWATRRQITMTQAQQIDRTQTNLGAFAPLLELADQCTRATHAE